MTEASVPFWTLRKKSSRGSQARDEGEENPYNQGPYCFTLDELMKGGSNDIHSIALRHMP